MVKANEIPKVDLLERDVTILFYEARRLRAENEALKVENDELKKALADAENAEIKSYLEKEERNELAYFIKSQRQAREMNKRQFAKLLAISIPTLSNYERGHGDLKNIHKAVEKIRGLKGAK